jgi:4-amino-4-deoxy-L-arabinose transferase-like glycosyltransferase
MNKHNENLWKIITALILFSSVALFILVVIPYAQIIQFLGKFQPDGSFDSLSPSEFNVLQWLIRGKALTLALIGLLSLLKKDLVIHWLQRFGAKISTISIRNDLNRIYQATFSLDDKWTILALFGVTVIGIFIRLIQINSAVGYDEAYTFIHFASRSLQVILTDYSAPNNHIFHSLLVYIVYHIFGNHIWALRLPAFLAGVLTIPAIYMAGKVIYGKNAALVAAALVACTPILVDFSVNARGYTLMCLFSCLILWIAGILRKQSSFAGWLLLSLFSILGFYTLPVMVYPVSAVYLWLLVSWVVKDIYSNSRGKFIFGLIVTSISTILITFLLYSPILIFGSGFSSITSNEFVKSQSWLDFIQSVQSRIPRVWGDWNYLVPYWVAIITILGFLLLVVFEWRRFSHKIPVWIPTVISISILIILQRVTPWPRVWLFLLVFYLLWAAAGWLELIRLFTAKITLKWVQPVFMWVIILLTLIVYVAFRNKPSFNPTEDYPMQEVAEFVSNHITNEDTLVAVSPVTIQTGYYLTIENIPFERFYDRDRKGVIKHAIVLIADRSKFPSLQSVVEFQRLQGVLDTSKAELIHQYKQMLVYSVPVLP